MLRAILHHHRDRFEWKHPPYEYEYNRLPIDLILGDSTLRRRIERLEDITAIESSWNDDLVTFLTTSREHHIYK